MLKLILILMGMASCFQPKAPSFVSGVVSYQYGTAIRLITVCSSGARFGSGVIIDDHHVLTAKHVALCNDEDPSSFPLGIVGIDYEHNKYEFVVDKEARQGVDMARLVVADNAKPFKFWARLDVSNEYAVGTQVCSVGGDSYVFLSHKCGEIIPGSDEEGETFTNLETVPGNSGGPVWSINDLTVIGIVVKGRWDEGHEKIGVFVPIWKAREELLSDIYQ